MLSVYETLNAVVKKIILGSKYWLVLHTWNSCWLSLPGSEFGGLCLPVLQLYWY